MLQITKGKAKMLKAGFEYEPIIIKTKNHTFEQTAKGYFYQFTSGAILGAATGVALLIGVLIAFG